jgi:hypothetical protein
MSGKRIRIVAAQAVIVGALLLVVYLTLLRPEEQKPLFGVAGPGQVAQAPGGEAAGEPGGGGGGGRHGEAHAGGGHRHGGAGNNQGPGAAAPTGTVGTAVSQPAALPAPTRDGGEGGAAVTPSEQQYDDTVSRLFGSL